MAKRFTDTDKWKKQFIRALDAPYKLLWFYILDDCDLAGVWQVDFEVAEIRIGTKITQPRALELFKEKILVFDDGKKWFIKDFVPFQYGELRATNRMHSAVIATLKKNNLNFSEGASEGLPSPQGQGNGKGQGKGQGQYSDDNDFREFEEWTKAVLSGNDWLFNDKLRNMNIPVGERLEEFATSHLALLAKYPKMKPTDQNRFRISLIGHIQEKLSEKTPHKNGTQKRTVTMDELT